jgi:hypothetical protein
MRHDKKVHNIITETLILKGANLALTRDGTMSTVFHDSFWHPVLARPLRDREETSLSLSVLVMDLQLETESFMAGLQMSIRQ